MEGNTIIAEFRTSKQADSIECIIPFQGIRQDCKLHTEVLIHFDSHLICLCFKGSSGQFSIPDLEDGSYLFRVVARADVTERAEASRSLIVSTEGAVCGAHLINSGVSVTGGRATIEFSSSGLPVSGFQCSLDNAPLEDCKYY